MIYRTSIDTFHFGLKIEFSELDVVMKKIKDYLFFKDFLSNNYTFCSNRFYQCETKCDEFGFYMYSVPRKNCKNDMITIQLTGKFFRNIVRSRHFIEKVLSEFSGCINFQRIDVALDVIYGREEFTNVPLCLETNTIGFPMPRYSKKWKKSKCAFVTYGRLYSEYNNSTSFVNMVSQGRGDVVFRVYDKTLDLREKYHDTYSHVYGFRTDDECFQVYRIELQARSDKLKRFFDKLMTNLGFYCINYNCIIDEFIAYMFSKYDFLMVSKSRVCNMTCDSDFSVRNVSSSESMMRYYKQQQNICYQKYCLYYSQYCDDIKLMTEDNARISPLIASYNKEVAYKFRLDHADYNDFSQGGLDLCPVDKNQENLPF